MFRDYNSQLKVICNTNIGHGSDFCVVVTDTLDQNRQCGLTNHRGIIVFDVNCNTTYEVQVYPCGCYQPHCQTRWVHINECNKVLLFCFYEQQFSKPLAKLKITLCDKYYPEYKLEKGEFQLWRIF